MVWISAPHFTAGVGLDRGRVASAAPILKYMKGWTLEQVIGYARERGWETETFAR
jgi:hypothetical protein